MKTILVLGMHRSATSLVAKSLNHEIYMGNDLFEANINNPEGYFENEKFVKLNNRIFGTAGGSWLNPPSRSDILSIGFRFEKEIKELIEEEGKGREIWGWKDPRTVLTIDLYLPFLKGPHFICCFRDPSELAQSLYKREKIDMERGKELTHYYNQCILEFLSGYYAGKVKGQ